MRDTRSTRTPPRPNAGETSYTGVIEFGGTWDAVSRSGGLVN